VLASLGSKFGRTATLGRLRARLGSPKLTGSKSFSPSPLLQENKYDDMVSRRVMNGHEVFEKKVERELLERRHAEDRRLEALEAERKASQVLSDRHTMKQKRDELHEGTLPGTIWGPEEQTLCDEFLAFKNKHGNPGIERLTSIGPGTWFRNSTVEWEIGGFQIGFINPADPNLKMRQSESKVAEILRRRTRVYLCEDGKLRAYILENPDRPRIEDLPLADDGSIVIPSIGYYSTSVVMETQRSPDWGRSDTWYEVAGYASRSLESRLLALAAGDRP
jgi:hypothetical protein